MIFNSLTGLHPTFKTTSIGTHKRYVYIHNKHHDDDDDDDDDNDENNQQINNTTLINNIGLFNIWNPSDPCFA